jgi:hypothetical protein
VIAATISALDGASALAPFADFVVVAVAVSAFAGSGALALLRACSSIRRYTSAETDPRIMRPLPLRTPSSIPVVRAFSASVGNSITENFSAFAAAFTASRSSARNHEACGRPEPVGVP